MRQAIPIKIKRTIATAYEEGVCIEDIVRKFEISKTGHYCFMLPQRRKDGYEKNPAKRFGNLLAVKLRKLEKDSSWLEEQLQKDASAIHDYLEGKKYPDKETYPLLVTVLGIRPETARHFYLLLFPNKNPSR